MWRVRGYFVWCSFPSKSILPCPFKITYTATAIREIHRCFISRYGKGQSNQIRSTVTITHEKTHLQTSILLRVFCIQYIKYVQNYPVRYSIKISHRIPLFFVFFAPILSRTVLRYCFGALILVVLFGAYQLWRLFFSPDLGNTTESIIFCFFSPKGGL